MPRQPILKTKVKNLCSQATNQKATDEDRIAAIDQLEGDHYDNKYAYWTLVDIAEERILTDESMRKKFGIQSSEVTSQAAQKALNNMDKPS